MVLQAFWFLPAGSWDEVSPVGSEEIVMNQKTYHVVPLTSLMKRGAALAKSCGTLRPKYSNYVVEQDIEVVGLRPFVVGRIIEHHGSTLRQSWMSLGDHLRLRAAEADDKLAFSVDDFTCIEEALRGAHSQNSEPLPPKSTVGAHSIVLPMPLDASNLTAVACFALFAGVVLGGILSARMHWRLAH